MATNQMIGKNSRGTTPQGQSQPDALALRKLIEFSPLGEEVKVQLTIPLVRQFLCTPTRTGKLPNDAAVMRFMMLCEARRLNPWTGDAYLVGYDSQNGPMFNLITSVQALLKRAETNEEFTGFRAGVLLKKKDGDIGEREGSIVLDGEVLVGGWARVSRKDRTESFYVTVALRTYNKGVLRWKEDPAGMIRKCALAAALREAFPNLTAGMYLREEMQDDDLSAKGSQVSSEAVNPAPIPETQKRSVSAEDLFAGYASADADPAASADAVTVAADEPTKATESEVVDEVVDAEFTVISESGTLAQEASIGNDASSGDGPSAADLVHDLAALGKCKSRTQLENWQKRELAMGSDADTVVRCVARRLHEMGE